MPITDPWFYLAAVPAVMIVGISKGGFGGGLGTLAVPLIALAVPPVQAAAIMLPLLCFMDIFGLRAYWGVWDARNLAIMIPASAFGIVLGALTFRYFDETHLRLTIGTIAILFSAHYWFAGGAAGHPRRPRFLAGGAWSAVAGFTSTVAHAGGPPVQFYLLPQRMDKTVYVGTTVVFYFAINYMKLVPYALLGQFTGVNLATALVLAPLAPLAIWTGYRLHRLVSGEWFYVLCYGMLTLTGFKLVWDGLAAFAASTA